MFTQKKLLLLWGLIPLIFLINYIIKATGNTLNINTQPFRNFITTTTPRNSFGCLESEEAAPFGRSQSTSALGIVISLQVPVTSVTEQSHPHKAPWNLSFPSQVSTDSHNKVIPAHGELMMLQHCHCKEYLSAGVPRVAFLFFFIFKSCLFIDEWLKKAL